MIENSTHPATKASILLNGKEGRPSVFCATKGRRLKIEKGEVGYDATFYNILNDKKPVHIASLTLDQADALGWAFCSLDI